MSTPDPIRAALERLADELNRYDPKFDAFPDDALAAARAALDAAPEGEPSNEELLEMGQLHCISYTLSDGTVASPYQEGTDMRSEVLSYARAVLARAALSAAPAGQEGA